MKKILSLIAAVLLALTAFASCSKKNDKLVVAVPNDATNEARALLLLEKQGYIKLKEGAGITATVRRTLGGDIDASCGQLRRKYNQSKENP